MGLGDRVKHVWNAFFNKDPTGYHYSYGMNYSTRPDRPRFTKGTERSIATSVYNRIATDVSSIEIQHVQLDEDDRYTGYLNTGLNRCLTLEANLDQTHRALKHDEVLSLLDEGEIAIVPVEIETEPTNDAIGFDVLSLRVGKIVEWRPKHVRVRLYNENTGQYEEVILEKRMTGIVENPFYAVMNEPNSTLKRLVRKLILLDAVDEQSGSGKLDLIIQLPYVIKTDARRQQAENRRKDIEDQLAGSKYGIAYTDGTERITQLNRPVENNLMKQIEFLTSMLYSQLGITQAVLDGTADEATMQNYYSRTVGPIIGAIVDEMKRKFLSEEARAARQSIMFFRDPFELIPVTALADIADKLTRNEITSSNEIRQKIGFKPSKDPRADELRNKNISESKASAEARTGELEGPNKPKEEIQNA